MSARVPFAIFLLALSATVVLVWLLMRTERAHDRTALPVDPGSAVERADKTGGDVEPTPSRGEVDATPSPADVVGHPDCRMALGDGFASDAAVVVVPASDGAWYAVVDDDGVVFDGTLSFLPDRLVFGERPGGSMLAGFGRDGKVRILQDGGLIYAFDDAWDFDIAGDGSSFYAVEPLAGAARLVVHNLDLGEEHHYELDDSLAPTGSGRNFGTSYSADFGEVIVSSLQGGAWSPGTRAAEHLAAGGIEFSIAPMSSVGVQRFFDAAGGPPRTVVVEGAARGLFVPSVSAVFASSETAYDVRFEDGAGWRVTKVHREYGPDGRVSRTRKSWSRDVSLTDSSPLLPPILSANGGWLGVWGDELEILETTSGEPVVLPEEYKDGDEDGLGFEFRGDRLLHYARDGESVVVHAVDLGSERGNGPDRATVAVGHEPAIPAVGGILNDYSLEMDWDRTPGPSPRVAACGGDLRWLGRLRLQEDGRLTYER